MNRLLWIVALVPALAFAQVPQKMGYQGRLISTDGTPRTGSVSITFSICATPTGGTALWSETQSLGLTDGYYATHEFRPVRRDGRQLAGL